MPLHSPWMSRERVLAIGGYNSGKTTGWLDIARWHLKTRSEARFRVVDTDNAVEHMLDLGYPELAAQNGGNVEVLRPRGWTESVEAIVKAEALSARDDWLVVDMLGPLWGKAEEHYIEQVYGENLASFYVSARKNEIEHPDDRSLKGGALDGRKDWGQINREWRVLAETIRDARCHVYATSPAVAINSEKDEKDVLLVFGPYGYKPMGQKHLGHLFHTVHWMFQVGKESWGFTTMKDRERVRANGAELKSLTTGWLVKAAGWKLS